MAQGEMQQSAVRARLLGRETREPAIAHLARDPLRNLLLLDLVSSAGEPPRVGEVGAQLLGAFEGSSVRGVLALRPSLVLDADVDEAALDIFLPYLSAAESGLVKSPRVVVDALWRRLSALGRQPLVDRIEHGYAVHPGAERLVDTPPGYQLRRAEARDLEALVTAARASLREEDRPDPFDGDPVGFRRWVRGRLQRARVIEEAGRVVFVGYADVCRREGWLVQGVYTWPEQRRRGLAEAGMSGLVREALDAGAAHVQLAVIEGNGAARGLYGKLGFEPFEELRTILFA